MKKTVFISSTYEDLKDYRQEVWELLESYEVNVKGMEEFGARSKSALQTCLDEVERSDIYVGIIGFKLGSVEKKTGKSFTKIEYEKAIEDEKEILIYLIEDDAEISIKHVDFGERHEKLVNFKKLLKEKHTVDFFKDEDELTAKLDKRFEELLSSKEEKEKVEEDNTYEAAQRTIQKFTLAPKLYNDQEVKLKVKFLDSAHAVSKEFCDNFNFRYGKTIGVSVEIIEPQDITSNLNKIILKEEFIEKYFQLELERKYVIGAKLLFTSKNIDKERANFFSYTRSNQVENPNYNPSLPATDEHGFINQDMFNVATINSNPFTSQIHNPRFINEYEVIEGDGKIILLLQELETK